PGGWPPVRAHHRQHFFSPAANDGGASLSRRAFADDSACFCSTARRNVMKSCMKQSWRIKWQIIGVMLLTALLFSPAFAADKYIVVASTTSTQNSSLFGYLLPKFQDESGIEVRVVAVGTGAALDMGRRCDADVVLVHAPKAEKAYVEEGSG